MKIDDLTNSIYNESVRIGHKERQLRRSGEGLKMFMNSRKPHKQRIDEELKGAEGKCGGYRHISEVNRKLYGLLISKEKSLNERIIKGIAEAQVKK